MLQSSRLLCYAYVAFHIAQTIGLENVLDGNTAGTTLVLGGSRLVLMV